MSLERLTANLAVNTRRETLNGREYLVAPITLLVPGIHNGSQGSVYYSQEELEKDPSPWNGMPLVLNHPKSEEGAFISARTPAIIQRYGLGQIFNSTSNGKLGAEAWFDVEKTRQIDPTILNRLEAGETIETSTGLSARLVAVENGQFNGKRFSHQATNFVPDHVAILPDSVGACSVKDGCGVLVNEDQNNLLKEIKNTLRDFFTGSGQELKNTGDSASSVSKEINMQKEKLINELVSSCGCYSDSDKEVLNTYSEEKLEQLHKHALEVKQNAEIVNSLKEGFQDSEGNKHVFNVETKQFETTVIESKEVEIVENMSVGIKDLAPELQKQWEEMEKVFNERKKSLVQTLVANIEDETAKLEKVEYLSNKSIQDLETIESLMPQKEQAIKTVSNAYIGASGAASYVENSSDHDYDDVLDTVSWNA